MYDIALVNAAAYAAKYNLRLAERLGFGIHGAVHVGEHAGKHDQSAIKALNSAEFYVRERAVYDRLRHNEVVEILGFHVPQLIRGDDDLWVIEMTIVSRPFVLDFAGAYLDRRPEFSEEPERTGGARKQEEFGARWKTVERVINTFEELGIYLVDVTPNNIAF
jgi:hypothetical protein